MFAFERPQIPRFLLGFALAVGILSVVECSAEHLGTIWIPDPLQVQVSDGTSQGNAHPFLLWEEPPGVREVGGVHIEINRMGMRGPEIPMPKPARERRLMVIGDGVGFGEGVQAHQTLGQVAVDELGGERVGLELINGSVRGYSTLQSLNLMDLRGWALDPDVLVLVESPTDRQISNHIDDEVVPLVQPSGLLPGLLSRFAAFRLLDYMLGVKRGRHYRRYHQVLAGEIEGNPDRRARLDPNARARAVRGLIERCQARGVGTVFLISPLPADLSGAVPAEVALYRKVLRDAAGSAGAALVEGGQVFAGTGRPPEELWLDEVHPTAFGHRMLGRALADTLGRWIRGGTAGGQSRGGALPHYRLPAEETE